MSLSVAEQRDLDDIREQAREAHRLHDHLYRHLNLDKPAKPVEPDPNAPPPAKAEDALESLSKLSPAEQKRLRQLLGVEEKPPVRAEYDVSAKPTTEQPKLR